MKKRKLSRDEYETISVCSDCGDEELSDMRRCPVCGRWFDQEGEEGSLCPGCAQESFERFLALARDQFAPEELLTLQRMIDDGLIDLYGAEGD